jgi:hypothetical protein
MLELIKAVSSPISAVGNILDNLFTSEDEKLSRAEVMARIQQQPKLAQTEINKIEAQHRSLFVSGWRPFIGWVCGINLAYLVCIRDWLVWITTAFHLDMTVPPPVGMDITVELVVALLGLGGLRTFEKIQGRAK